MSTNMNNDIQEEANAQLATATSAAADEENSDEGHSDASSESSITFQAEREHEDETKTQPGIHESDGDKKPASMADLNEMRLTMATYSAKLAEMVGLVKENNTLRDSLAQAQALLATATTRNNELRLDNTELLHKQENGPPAGDAKATKDSASESKDSTSESKGDDDETRRRTIAAMPGRPARPSVMGAATALDLNVNTMPKLPQIAKLQAMDKRAMHEWNQKLKLRRSG